MPRNGARPAISGLLFHRSPSTVAWLVSPVIVDALDGQSGRAISHVGVESLKRLPPIANANASRPIVFGLNVVGLAPSADSLPRAPLSRGAFPVRRRCGRSICAERHQAVATTRKIPLRQEILASHHRRGAAVAPEVQVVDERFAVASLSRLAVTDERQPMDFGAGGKQRNLSFAHVYTYHATVMDGRSF